MDFRIPGILMIFPTLFLAVYITVKFRKVISELYHNLAVCLWIMANTIWMIGEFFFEDTLRPFAIIFFVAGLMVLLFYYGFVYRKIRNYPDSIE